MYYRMENNSVVNEVRSNYYRCCNSQQLSVRDLLILIMGTVIKNKPISSIVDDILDKGILYISSLSEIEISIVLGLDENQSFHLMSVLELARRINQLEIEENVTFRNPSDVYRYLMDMNYFDREHFVVVYLDCYRKVIGRETIFIGSLTKTIVHPREVFKRAIKRNADSIVLAHNHPSGETSPSPRDVEVTNLLVRIGELIDIQVVDHLIIGGHKFTSFAEKKLINRSSSSAEVS